MRSLKIDFNTAVALVVANMIGTGVFTSLGFQVFDIHSVFSLLMLWIIGGIVALCGALTYGEIGSVFPQSGGEYNYLSKLYHPAIGFVSGWISVTVGFAAPIAAAAMALGGYASKILPSANGTAIALSVIILITSLHATDVKLGSKFQKFFTAFKIISILFIIIAGICSHPLHRIDILPQSFSWTEICSAPFAVSLAWVSYAYSGWNASSYIAGELENPQKNLPRSLFLGTAAVMILYVALNYVFLYTVPAEELKGVKEVGYLSAEKIFGTMTGSFMGLLIALLLVSTLSSMILAGPRVMQSMGSDIIPLKFFTIKNKRNVPYVAVIFQSVIAVTLVLTSSFESLVLYVGFTLSLCTLLTACGIFIIRSKYKSLPAPYRTWGYPVTPLIFIASTTWVLIFILRNKPAESLYGLLTVAAGLVFYRLSQAKNGIPKG